MQVIEGVRVEVEKADALDRPTDVLVLKYAQSLYGVDRAAVQRMAGLAAPDFPEIGGHTVIRRPSGLAARTLLMVGTPPLQDFSYRDIREIGRNALRIPHHERLRAEEICLTLHGVGFGLDEAEAFRAEIAGVIEALRSGVVESSLRTVTILERDADRVDRLRELLDNIWVPSPGGSTPRAAPPERASRRVEAAGYDTASRPHAFVAMPFHADFTDRFHYGIARPLRRLGLVCERMDQMNFTGDVVAMMRRRIAEARIIVADISSANPNVYLEIGYAWACGRPTVLLCGNDSEPLFDVRGQRFLRYESIRELEEKLTQEIVGLLKPEVADVR